MESIVYRIRYAMQERERPAYWDEIAESRNAEWQCVRMAWEIVPGTFDSVDTGDRGELFALS